MILRFNISLFLMFVFVFSVRANEATIAKENAKMLKDEHTKESFKLGLENAQVGIPGEDIYVGLFKSAPQKAENFPTVIFLHGSTGVDSNLGYYDYQNWLASNGIASIIFDSMQLKERIIHKGSLKKEEFEKIHKLRASEIVAVLGNLDKINWINKSKLILAGTSEGAVSVARNENDEFIGKIIYSWSCENNYYVENHNTSQKSKPILSIISSNDKYFSKSNRSLNSKAATGNCGKNLARNSQAKTVVIYNAPHTLINLETVKDITLGFIQRLMLE